MVSFTQKAYDYNNCIDIEDSEMYYNVVFNLKNSVNAKIDEAMSELDSACSYIGYDSDNVFIIEEKKVNY